jgi:hypothetical protein
MQARSELVVCRLKTGVRRSSHADPTELAVKALHYIAEDRERLRRFLDTTGIQPEAIRSAAQMPSFLPSLLDYVLDHEWLVTGLAAYAGVDPSAVASARDALTPGFDGA